MELRSRNLYRTVCVAALSGLVLLGIVLAALYPPLYTPAQAQDGEEEDATPTPTPPPPALVELNEEVIKRATVYLMQTYQNQGQPIISCVGSGTLISADGLILTNAHTAVSSERCRSDRIVVSVTVRLDEPPVPTYTAEIIEVSTGLNLAVLRINGYLDGRPIEPGTLSLPFVELGDSDSVMLDDTITVVGYPDLGNTPVEVTRGTVTGFTAEARAGDRAWIRTGAVIPGTMTGGGAYSRDGRLIGIPTIAPTQASGAPVDCRILQDTNLDGRANSSDSCVPVGGFISALRPSNVARGLVRAASLGIRLGQDYTSAVTAPPEAEPSFSRLFFATRVNEAGVPANVVGSAPAGITSLYLFFDYQNMVNGMIYELRVTVDDVTEAIYGLPPATWSGGRSGTWYIGSSNIPWKNGVYFFRLFIEGREVASRSIVIGGGPTSEPGFSDIVFGLLDRDTGGLVGTSYVLPEGEAIQARFNYRNMTPGTPWTYIWYYEGRELARGDEVWTLETQGTHIITAQAEFLPGRYRLELGVNNTLSATADFVVAGGAEANRPVIFTDLRVSTQQPGAPGTVQPARTEFPAGIQSLVVFFDWRLISPGTPWTWRWLIDGDPLIEVTEPWDAPPEGEDYFVSLEALQSLPDGTYTLEIAIQNVPLASVSARVGLGQLPVGVFASAEGVQMLGRITDAATGQGIPGAMFIVLRPEYSVEDFTWSQTQVLGTSLADSQGYYQIPVLLARGTSTQPLLYSILVRAEGYLPVSADAIVVDDRTQSPVEINVELSRG